MRFLKSFIVSFSMYSILPMPRIEWDKDSLKYTFVFFPWIGLLIGAVSYGGILLSGSLGLNRSLAAIFLVLIPIILSGGIHMDGLIDTCDAVFSYGDKEKKLEILKDPRTGAFGVMGCSVYLLLLYGFWSQLLEKPGYVILVFFIYFISRSLGAAALLTVKKAKTDGLGSTFADAAGRRLNLTVLVLYLILGAAAVCMINIVLVIGILVVLSSYLFWYRSFILKNFGGITGDLTGFLICSVELLLLIMTAIGGLLC